MPEPITAVAALAKVASSASPDALAPGLLMRVFGPAADEIGKALARWTSYRVGNVKRITEKADAKSRILGRHGMVNPRVAHTLLEAGSFCDDELMAEYLGGVLAGCRTPDGRDDRAVVWSGLITRLSSFQVRAHFLLYREWVDRLAATELDLGQDRSLATMYVDLDEFRLALMQDAELDTEAVLLHTTTGLAANDLIDEAWIYGETSKILGAQQQCSFSNSLRVHPTITGVELFGWAQGLPGLTVDEWTKRASIVDQDDTIPRLQHVGLPKIAAMLAFRREEAAKIAAQSSDAAT